MKTSIRERPSYKGKRYSSIIMYPEDVKAKKVIEDFWRPKMNHRYSFADILRALTRAEAKIIERTEKSILDSFPNNI